MTLILAETSVAKSRLSVPHGANFIIINVYWQNACDAVFKLFGDNFAVSCPMGILHHWELGMKSGIED